MKLYIVVGTTGGFCREDPDVPAVYGAFTDEETAQKIRTITQSKIEVVELDEIKPGYTQTLKALGLEIKHG